MTTFIQLHILTAYAPANLNRDDTGRPKTAIMGGVERLRVSSQSLKRAWRTSEVFESALSGHIGTRTRRLGSEIYKHLLAGGVAEKMALSAAGKIASQFGKLKADKNAKAEENLNIEQLVHISPDEYRHINQLVETLIADKREPEESELKLLRETASGVDIALFGRMLASSPAFNVEAACQVAHALGVSAVTVEEDFFTAVDDLNRKEDDAGSAHMGEKGFASALFYSYICISRDLLLENLNGDEALVARTLKALAETALTVSPTGNQNSFASRAYASYALVEMGRQQPRALSVAFFNPVRGEDQQTQAIQRLKEQRQKFERAYGSREGERHYEMNVESSEGSLQELLEFVSQ
ncbi:type I-E CRISPR-associated protein Cas7/Cse4/CasC [Citrobacter braakii]|jgi:CRISPR system Cascade subunit CasC|uniref:type I-E CRISPR-associated protein Cas7/Cse4/CasC n=1 Tax=Citrobacter TaxID=544 RepID=UPI0015E9FA41|nr:MULTISPECIES: type I-E CRISPR-associated protein Cas7/Cse4/CasC [Citrobacter]MCI1668539.1 type I-E CRISPR-associated protein Cas7/Cse4/CasC [Citrobacter freundii]MCI1824823.1 type I-E CRISPR-associated protein Cas7/Cse4/CasC [Citrobacter freundii]MDT7113943.1 type I-E CRISPR-associated protein Cas7/Cse4/CasC [Citrobacter braakii]QLS63981.1 type I-E CRISPR-associated protein Cas7/Cse4/CasC [Citrobacter sp. RHBSTW-00881]